MSVAARAGRLAAYEIDLNHSSKVTAQSREKKETEVADQIFLSFTNFLEVGSVRDKRQEARKIGV